MAKDLDVKENEIGKVTVTTEYSKIKVDYSVSKETISKIFKLADRLSKCFVRECGAKCRNKKIE